MKKRIKVEYECPKIIMQNRLITIYRSTRVNQWGNSWCIIPYWCVLTYKERSMFNGLGIDKPLKEYEYACRKIKGSGLRPYKGKDFGGGLAMIGSPIVVMKIAMSIRYKRLKQGT